MIIKENMYWVAAVVALGIFLNFAIRWFFEFIVWVSC
jgi:hypothetical protein